ncbi:hypothetical protein N658DRAFT_490808 [Parathielavia hyrcaniae]|uniref:SnoaL-like domain-containing protein n=1 Tax=Parathielavia hyrcaniae TaxID=113614 RepID=A0AAN6Q9M9_9PEZI|nr:hypothetical protein N658DRAFT_490808 [Parathielavia hyrcaniae]
MLVSALLLTCLVPLSLGTRLGDSDNAGYDRDHGRGPRPDLYEAIHQRESILAETLDTKDWGRLGKSMTDDIVYDSRPLGPNYGGLSVGLDQVIENLRRVFGDAMVAHHVSNAIIRPNRDATAANVTT